VHRKLVSGLGARHSKCVAVKMRDRGTDYKVATSGGSESLLPTDVIGREITGCKRLAMYDGASPCSALYVSRHNLNWTCCGTESQWRRSPDCSTCLFSWYGLLIMVGGVGCVGGDFSQTRLTILRKTRKRGVTVQ